LAIRTAPLKFLHTLILAYVGLDDVTESIEWLTQIHTLVLLENNIETVPTWLKEFNHLKKLVINENEITMIPGWIDGSVAYWPRIVNPATLSNFNLSVASD